MLDQLAALMNNTLDFNSSSLLQYYSTYLRGHAGHQRGKEGWKVLWNSLIEMKTKENLIGEKLLVFFPLKKIIS